MSIANRRAPIKGVRRFPMTITLTPETDKGLLLIGNGNRSAAIEQLVTEHITKRERLRRRSNGTA